MTESKLMLDTVSLDLEQLLKDESCPSSTVWAKIKGCQDKNNEYIEGITRQHFEILHDRFIATPWTTITEWKQRVQYTACASSADSCQDDIVLSYDASDPIDVKCVRQTYIGEPILLQVNTTDDIKMLIKVKRTKMVECLPADEKKRYKIVKIQNYREFTRTSSSFKHISFKYSFVVEWSAKSLREAYASRPTYKLSVFADVATQELTDAILVGNTQVPNFLNDSTKLEWLQNNFKAKISDICLGYSLAPANLSDFNTMKTWNFCHKSDDIFSAPIDNDTEVIAEEQNEEEVECFDDGDEDQDEYM